MKGSLCVVPGKYDVDLIFLIIHILLFPFTVNKIISPPPKKKNLSILYFLKPMNLCCMRKVITTVDIIKVVNQLTLRWGDYSGL